ncbi:MAG: glycosyltransferase, partial [Candidatus Sericytochromatia bacterium]|nr:glycosyltransferase [Candidatus Tanganyikabacteria bacterium]
GTVGASPAPRTSARLAAQRRTQREAALLADLLLPNSAAETAILRAALGPDLPPCRVVPNACDAERFGRGDAARFAARHGASDFVLCAARWDDRKNLLQLAAAMHDTGLRLVLAGGRPDPGYADLVRAHLPPGALVLEHLAAEDLADAYAAARVHALPSWFETPGLSSLEAALADCALVVGDRAAEREYFGDAAYYCDPGDVASIRQAMLAAHANHERDRPARERLRARIRAEFSWDRAAAATLAAYEEVLGRPAPAAGTSSPAAPDLPLTVLVPEPARPDWLARTEAELGPGDRLESLPEAAFGPAVAAAATPLVLRLEAGTELPPGGLARLRAHLARQPGAAAVGPVLPGAPGVQGADLAASATVSTRCELLGGRCLLMRRDPVAAAGGWDGALAPEHADRDLAWRLRLAGYTLLLAGDVVAAPPAARAVAPEALDASADRLAAKLEQYYGRGLVPTAEALWGVSDFFPAMDLWGPVPTAFETDPADPRRERLAESFAAAFGPADPVTLDGIPPGGTAAGLPPPGPALALRRPLPPGASQPGRASAGPSPVEIAARAVAGQGPGERMRVVRLAPGRPVSPDLLRQVAGYRPRPAGRPLISVVVRAIDAADHARLCFDALLRCTQEPYELVVVDPGVGARAAGEIARVLARRPEALWLRPPGAVPAWNFGLAVAHGEYVALLAGDALVADGWLTYLQRHLESAPDRVAVGPRSNVGPGDQALGGTEFAGAGELRSLARARARDFAGECHPVPVLGDFALLLRRALLARVGGFDPGYPAGSLAAADFLLRARLAGGTCALAEDVYVHQFGLAGGSGAAGPDRELALERFGTVWGPLPADPTLADLEARFAAARAAADAVDLFRPLPDPAASQLLGEPLSVSGMKACNLLLSADWDSPGEKWRQAMAWFARTFDQAAPVALLLLAPPESALDAISALLDEVRPAGDGPDLLVVEERVSLAGAVAAARAVILTGAAGDAPLARAAGLLGVPLCHGADPEALAALAADLGAKPHANFM